MKPHSRIFSRKKKIRGLEILLIGSGPRAESRFGHVALRFLRDGEDPMLDPVISYGANVDEPRLDRAKAVYGGYKLAVDHSKYQQFLFSNIVAQRRSVERIVLPSDPAQRLALHSVVAHDFKESQAHYTFFGMNCTMALQSALRRAGFDIRDADRIPLRVAEFLTALGISPYPPVSLVRPVEIMKRFLPLVTAERIKDLFHLSPVDYQRAIFILKPEMKERGLTFSAYRSKPRTVGVEEPSFAEILGAHELPDDLYASTADEPVRWAGLPVFSSTRNQFCHFLKSVLTNQSGFYTERSARRSIYSNYRENCTSTREL